MLAPAGADKRGPKAPFPLVEMQEYNRRFAREYPPELRREPGLTESTAMVFSLESSISFLTSMFRRNLTLSFFKFCCQFFVVLVVSNLFALNMEQFEE